MSEPHKTDAEHPRPWPGVFNINGDWAFLAILGVIVLGWIWFILHDLIGLSGQVDAPIWMDLFTSDGPIGWLQWFVLILSTVLAGYLAGRLRGEPATFFLFVAFGIALIFVESASDLRFMLYLEYTSRTFGPELGGISTRVINDVVFTSAILVVPVFAVARYWRVVCPSTAARTYLIAGVVFYANALIIAAMRHVDGYYFELGQAIDSWFFFSHWPVSLIMADLFQHRFIVEFLLRETMEAIGAACLMAMVLSYANWHRSVEGGD